MSNSSIGLNTTLTPNITRYTTTVPQYQPASMLSIISSNFLAISILNTLFNAVAILLDVISLKGIISARNFSEGTRVFLANMTILDLIGAITLQPTLTAYLIVWLKSTGAVLPMLFNVFNALHYIVTISSFLSFLAVSLDRYLLIFVPFAYCNFMDTKKAIAICCLLNLQGVISFTILRFNAPRKTELKYLNVIMYVIAALLILIHARIMLAARRMHKRIRQNSTVDPKQTMLRRKRVEMKQAGVTFGLFLTIIVCFMPIIVVQSIWYYTGDVALLIALALYWSVFIMLVCPILKQILLCVLNSAIRAAIRKWLFGEDVQEVNLALRSVRNKCIETQQTCSKADQCV